MIRSQTIRAVLIASLTAICHTASAADEVRLDHRFVSPDGRFTAQLTNDEKGNIRITDNKTGQVYKEWAVRPLYSLKWTRDSKTIVTIEHLAGGSETALIHFSENRWSRFPVSPPVKTPPYHHYRVIRQEIEGNKVKLTYKVTDEQGNGMVTKFYTCSFEVNPSSRVIGNVIEREIDGATYETLYYSE